FGGFDEEGAPIYSEYEDFEWPEFFQTFVTRIYYDSENDVMYLSGYGESRQHDKWFDGEKNLPVNGAGTHLLRYDDWKAGNREPSYKIDLPWDGSNRSLPPKTWYKAGDYIFTAPVRPKDGKTIISVFNAHSGEFKGTMSHYDKFGQTGWIDITRGLTAFQRSNGEYIVILEDNAYAKNIVYRWTPPDVTYRKTGTVESDARVHKGQEKSDALAELPERVDVIGENGERGDAAVEWEIPKYEGKRPGRYKAVGRLTLPAGWKGDPDNANATVTVTTATEDDKTETLWSHDFEDETNMGIWSPTKWEEKDLPAPPSDGTFVGKASVSSDGGYSANNARITPEKRLPPGDVKKLVYSAQVYIPEYDQDALDWARITYNFMAGDEDGNRMNDDPNLDIANPDGMTMFEDVPVGEWHDIEFTIDITEWQDHPDAVHFRGLWNPLQISVDKDALGEGEDYEFTAYIDNVKVQYRPPAATEDPTDQEAERQR
ncbi:MAG: Ig-like domain-containing protein, partial [Planctomycetota bacterium]